MIKLLIIKVLIIIIIFLTNETLSFNQTTIETNTNNNIVYDNIKSRIQDIPGLLFLKLDKK